MTTNICLKEDIAFITMTNKGYIDYTLNCYKSLEKCGTNFNLVSHVLDNEAFNILSKKKYPCVFVNNNKLKDFVIYNHEGWGTMMFTKMKIIYEQLQKHKYVCLTDGDIVFNDNRFMEYCYNMSSEYDIIFQNNSLLNKTPSICAGFVFIKSNENTKKLYNINEISKVSTEQGCLNGRMKKNPNLKVGYLPLELFPNGKYFGHKHEKIKPYLIHFNHMKGSMKVRRMKKHNVWYLKEEFDVNKAIVSKDVTSICNNLLTNGVLSINKGEYNKFFSDISKGKKKQLLLDYKDTSGIEKQYNISEKESLKINASQIIRAVYYVI